MSKNLQSTTKLTEFAPLQLEEKQHPVGQFITKLFKLDKTPATPDSLSTELRFGDDQLPHESRSTWDANSPSTVEDEDSYFPVVEERSLPNVLKRISNLLALKNKNLQTYSDTDLKQYWMPDSVSKECYECGEKFSTFRRRHHCRVCGQIFCSHCCSQQIPGKIFGCSGDLRVCNYCYGVVLSYLNSPEADADLKILQESLLNKQNVSSPSGLFLPFSTLTANFPFNNLTSDSTNTTKRKISVGYQEENFALGRSSDTAHLSAEEKCQALKNSLSLKNLYDEISHPASGVVLQTHHYRLRTYKNCFFGSDLIEWLINHQKAHTRIQASALCQALLEGNYIVPLSEQFSFVDGCVLYKLEAKESFSTLTVDDNTIKNELSWMQGKDTASTPDCASGFQDHFVSSTSYTLDLNVEATTVYISKPINNVKETENLPSMDVLNEEIIPEETSFVKTSEFRELIPESGWSNPTQLRDENGEKLAYKLLTTEFNSHKKNLLTQLLTFYGLPHVWNDIVMQIVQDILSIIKPDKNHDAKEIDIRHYVHFKKVCAGNPSDTELIHGIVISKSVAHKRMLDKIEKPKILLLQCPLVYQRTEGRLMSLEPIILQEYEYLRNVVARIVALHPSIVVIQRNVSRLAQDMLRDQGIILVFNVKQAIIDRLAQCTQADIVTSMDAYIGRPKLGTCNFFYLKTFTLEDGLKKTLMYFEGFPNFHLGSTVLLRSDHILKLTKIKQVAKFFLYACYNWKLEKSYLMDEFALPPDYKDEFFDEGKENVSNHKDNKTNVTINSKKIESENRLSSQQFDYSEDSDFFNVITNKTEENINSKYKINKSETNFKKNLEDKRNFSEKIVDFSDPLFSCSTDVCKENNNETLEVASLPFSNYFRKALDGVILCVSPYLVFPLPYLETDMGKKCILRNYFPEDIFFSGHLENKKQIRFSKKMDEIRSPSVRKTRVFPHPFIVAKIHNNADNHEFQSLLANFRACGGRLKFVPERSVCKESLTNELTSPLHSHLDALNVLNHQKLTVLFCSFSRNSQNAPDFCVKMVVFMEFYGVNDIPLGCFLGRYCFRSMYECPSNSCNTSMLKHIRRFVHNGGCLNLFLNDSKTDFGENNIFMWSRCNICQKMSPIIPLSSDTWSFSFAKFLELRFYGVMFTRRGQTGCQHSLHHDHFQCFGYKNTVASFKYSSVQIWEIFLPPQTINIVYNSDKISQLIEESKSLSLKGHELYSQIGEKLYSLYPEVEGLTTLKQILTKERSIFKQKIEEVQLQLIDPILKEQCKSFIDYNKVCRIEDTTIRIKRLITEGVEQWNSRFLEVSKKKDNDKKRDKPLNIDVHSSFENQMPINNENLSSEDIVADTSYNSTLLKKPKSLDQEEDISESTTKVHHRSQSEGNALSQYEEVFDGKKEIDKKSVKNIFSQLLPSNNMVNLLQQPYSQHEHYTLPTGVSFPLVVYENELSSIIAYTLNSFDYKKSLEEIVSQKVSSSEYSPSPVHKRRLLSEKEKSENDNTEKTSGILSFLRNKDSKIDLSNAAQFLTSSDLSNPIEECLANGDKIDESKKGKSNYIEVQFYDHNSNFCCRVYYAEQFVWLRSIVLPDGEEAYIRSLSRCVQWNAQGGKSGSTFCKTKDERFILKEVQKSEIQLFLDSASNYFNYMQKCFTSGQPTLLGKIVGIYQVTCRNGNTNSVIKTNILIMENLFYNREVTHKFDLKGSMRNRLVNPDNQDGEIVLLDENLLKMTCDTPLYILPHSKTVLTAAIQNDTEFLSEQSVMDYSLLVGLDSKNKELILGIIDYIRTFTWDKKLETMVKKTGLLGGQGKLPTIISPKEYRKRFLEAMHRYFLVVPDHWAGLGQGFEY